MWESIIKRRFWPVILFIYYRLYCQYSPISIGVGLFFHSAVTDRAGLNKRAAIELVFG
jgi:hypothetical protein